MPDTFISTSKRSVIQDTCILIHDVCLRFADHYFVGCIVSLHLDKIKIYDRQTTKKE